MKLLVTLSANICMLLMSASAFAADSAMTAGDLQQICLGSNAESKAACRFYIMGITQGIEMGLSVADGKTRGGRPCVQENISGTALELAVKMKMGEDLMVFPDDRKLDASGFVGGIIVETFPCRKSK